MSDLSEAIAKQLDGLPQTAQLFYSEWINKADGNLFATLKDLSRSITAGEILPEHKDAANMAYAALNEAINGEPVPKVKTDMQAMGHMQREIAKAIEAGDEDRANMLKEAIVHSEVQAAETKERNLELQEQSESVLASLKEQNEARYQKTLSDEKDRIVDGLIHSGRLKPAEAEQLYERDYKQQTERAVGVIYGQN